MLHKSFYKLLLLLILATVPLSALWSAPDKENTYVLKLEEYLQLLKQNDPVIKQFAIQQEKVQFLIADGKQDDAIQLNVESEYGYGDDDIDTERLSARLEKAFLDTGTRLSLSHSTQENTDRDESISELELEQSLLKNSFGKDQQREVEVLKSQARIAELQALESYEDYLAEKIKLYLQFSKTRSEYFFLEKIMQDARSLYQFILKKSEKGAAKETDIFRARLQLIEREQELANSREELLAMQEALLRGLNLAVEQVFPELEIDLSEQFSLKATTFSLDSFRAYQVAQSQKQLGIDQLALSKNQDLADLRLFGAYTKDDSTRFTSSVNRSESSVGLRLSVPFASSKAKANKEIVDLEARDTKIGLESTAQNLLTRFRQQKIEINKLKQQMALSREKLVLIDAIMKDDNKRYQRGLIELDRVLDTSNDYYRYQFELNNTKLALNIAYLDWLSFNDLLLVENQGLSQ